MASDWVRDLQFVSHEQGIAAAIANPIIPRFSQPTASIYLSGKLNWRLSDFRYDGFAVPSNEKENGGRT
jgi:hypothetical protein